MNLDIFIKNLISLVVQDGVVFGIIIVTLMVQNAEHINIVTYVNRMSDLDLI